MSVFGFIENFFFISLALVFVLVLLLVYHFKNRITVAEKKSESMYGLLTAVVKEIKSLRGMFGLGGTVDSSSANISTESSTSLPIEVKSKTTPEVEVHILSTVVPNTPRYVDSSNNHGFSQFVKNQSVKDEPTETITFELSASENKIVVSDCNEDDESSIEDGEENQSESDCNEDDESESEFDSESEFEFPVKEDEPAMQIFDSELTLNHEDLVLSELNLNEEDNRVFDLGNVDVSDFEPINIVDILQEVESESEVVSEVAVKVEVGGEVKVESEVAVQVVSEVAVESETVNKIDEQPNVQVQESEPSFEIPKLLSTEQLRKMNINQLKNIASQHGISIDVSKMKKPELISLIQSNSNKQLQME
jgi:hypothetical protein